MAQEPDMIIEAGFSDAKLAREVQKVVDKYKAAGKAAEKAFQDSTGKVGESQALKAHMRELDKLQRAYDPVYTATKRYEGEVEKLNRALQLGAITQGKYADSIKQAQVELGRASGVIQDTGNKARGFGGQMSNVGFQIGDFATQVGAGTSAAQALGQQLPQLLGGFGAYGAAAGAAAAILIPLGAALIKVASDAESLDDAMKTVSASASTYTDALEAASVPLSDLREKYGDLADEIARANEMQLAYATAASSASLRGVGKSIAAEQGGISRDRQSIGTSPVDFLGVTVGTASQMMSEYERAVGRVRDKYKLAEPEARRFVDAVEKLSTSTGAKEQEEAIRAMMDALIAGVGSIDKAAEQFGGPDGIWSKLTEAHEAALSRIENRNQSLLAEFDATTKALDDLSEKLGDAEAARAKASENGKKSEIAAWDSVIAKIRETIYETKAASSATDTLFERMSKGAQGFLARAGSFAADATGRMSSSNAVSIGKAYAGMGERPNREELKALVGVDPATVAWCAAFMNAVLDKAGSKGTGSLAARSFLDWGTATDNPSYGDVVVLKRGKSSTAGHVGFYEGANPDGTIRVFGGNQGDRVGTDNFRRSDVLGYRRAPAASQYVDPQTVIEDDRIAREGAAAAEAEKESAAALKRQVAERERAAEAVREYGRQLAANLLTEQQTAQLEQQRAAQLQAINAGGGTDEQKAAAIAQVNAEMQRQITIMALTEEAKRRQVDLDAQMVGSTMTYRQAIEALGAAKAQQAIADQAAQASADNLRQAQEFAAQQTQALKDGLVGAIIEGENFSDVLGNVAQALAKAALQAALFGEGPMAGGGSGFLGGLFGGGGGFLSALFGGKPSFAGGGFTGAGPRSGGIDGQGGFPAILHPNETVIDHTRGQRAGMSYSPVFNIGGNVTPEDLAAVRREAAQGFQQMRREVPGIMDNHQKRRG